MQVEVKVVGLIGERSLALAQTLTLKNGARVKDALAALYDAGHIGKPVFKAIKKLRPPLFLVINDEKVDEEPTKHELADGDSVTVMQLSAGG